MPPPPPKNTWLKSQDHPLLLLRPGLAMASRVSRSGTQSSQVAAHKQSTTPARRHITVPHLSSQRAGESTKHPTQQIKRDPSKTHHDVDDREQTRVANAYAHVRRMHAHNRTGSGAPLRMLRGHHIRGHHIAKGKLSGAQAEAWRKRSFTSAWGSRWWRAGRLMITAA